MVTSVPGDTAPDLPMNDVTPAEGAEAGDDGVSAYLRAISRTRLLEPEQERDLATAVQAGRQALVQARRHLAARVRAELLKRPEGEAVLHKGAMAAADLVGCDAMRLAQWGRAVVAACAEHPPGDEEPTAADALHNVLVGLARGTDGAVTEVLSVATRAQLPQAEV